MNPSDAIQNWKLVSTKVAQCDGSCIVRWRHWCSECLIVRAGNVLLVALERVLIPSIAVYPP